MSTPRWGWAGHAPQRLRGGLDGARQADLLRPRPGSNGPGTSEGSAGDVGRRAWEAEMPAVEFEPRAFSEAAPGDRHQPRPRDAGRFAGGLWSQQPCSWMRRTEDSVFGRKAPWTCGWTRASGVTAGQVVNQDGRKRTRRSDLRIRRGKEIAANRQSNGEGPADIDDSGTGSSDSGCGPLP